MSHELRPVSRYDEAHHRDLAAALHECARSPPTRPICSSADHPDPQRERTTDE